MRRSRIVPAELFLNRVERLLRRALPRDYAKCPLRDFLTARKPFVRPGEKNRSGQAAFHNAVNVPADQFGRVVLPMPERDQTQTAQEERGFSGHVLYTEQGT